MQNNDIIERGNELLSNTPAATLDSIAHTQREIREKAIVTLIKPLDQASQDDILLFQHIPLGLVNMGDTTGALWYIETMGGLGNMLPWEVIERVCKQAFSDREMSMLQENDEPIRFISSSIEALFHMLSMHDEYKNKAEAFLLMGSYEEKKGDITTAVSFYEKAINSGSIQGYIACANLYEERGEYEQSRELLRDGWHTHHDTNILGRYISILCKTGNRSEAIQRYEELKNASKEKIPSFIVYKGTIENDRELEALEETVAQYITEGSYIPLESFKRLATEASDYIKKVLQSEQNCIRLTQDAESIKRHLYLMQTDILTLGNERYLDDYLFNIRRLGLEGDEYTRDVLHGFFIEHFSQEVLHDRLKRDTKDEGETEDTKDTENERENELTGNLFRAISLHVARIGELFLGGSFYEVQKETIIPLLMECKKQEGEYSDEIESELLQTLTVLKQESDFYNALRPDVRENYEYYIREFDQEYGVYFRRHIQWLADQIYFTSDAYPTILTQHPDVAFLFWCQKLVFFSMETNDPDYIKSIVETYALYHTNVANAILLGELLYHASIHSSIWFLQNYPLMLGNPQALYLITEGLRSIGKESREMTIKSLDTFVRDHYNSEDFFAQIDNAFETIFNDEPTEDEQRYILLVNGNVAILQGKDTDESILHFRTAGELGSPIGFMQAAKSYENMGKYDKALVLFERAFQQDDTIDVIKNILHCSILAKRFDIAQRYIDIALEKEYDMGNYILAFHLGQSNLKLAFLQAIHMIQNDGTITDQPNGLMKKLSMVVDSATDKKYTVPGEEETQILASFIKSRLTIRDGDTIIPLLNHWQDIVHLCHTYEGDVLYRKIQASLEPIVGGYEKVRDFLNPIVTGYENTMESFGSHHRGMEVPLFREGAADISVDFLQMHAMYLYEILKNTTEQAQESGRDELQKELVYTTNAFCAQVILLLQRFPNTDYYTDQWRAALNFPIFAEEVMVHKMPSMLQ